MAQRPYTIFNPFHSSSYYTLKRKAFCARCLHNDDFLKDGTEMPKGTQVIKVTIESGPSMRTQHFHPECYVSHVQHVTRILLDDRWKVYPIIDPSNVTKMHEKPGILLDREIERACANSDEYDFAADDIPF